MSDHKADRKANHMSDGGPGDTDDTAAPGRTANSDDMDLLAPRPRRRPPVQAPRWDYTPMYRVVEVFRDGSGMVRKEGRIWHPNLDLVRRFGRAVASNAAAQKVVVADSSGAVVENLPVAGEVSRRPHWVGWTEIPLPPRPPRAGRPAPSRPLRLPTLPVPAAEPVPAPQPASNPPPEQPSRQPPRLTPLHEPADDQVPDVSIRLP